MSEADDCHAQSLSCLFTTWRVRFALDTFFEPLRNMHFKKISLCERM